MLDITKRKMVTTRKEHECFACLEPINKGDSVIYITAKQDEQHMNFHLHLECNKVVAKRKIELQRGCLVEGVRRGKEMLDWKAAEEHLYEMQKAYQGIGFAGAFGLALGINPLVKRFEAGERTAELYEEIMEVQ